jgi:GalNAc-alpha-(1->4)-GalNAc-alpha-(1->3)-diNAcBac-PP-undecaprenol alpha-1,4-N-acetyl-D-galactosaminyltransferase
MNQTPMRLTLVISSLERGGAEKIMTGLANAWAEQGRNVTLITLDQFDVPAFPLHESVTLRRLAFPAGGSKHYMQAVLRNFRKLRTLRRAIRNSQPDVIVSFIDIPNIVTLLATRGLGMPVIVSERANPDLVHIGWIWRVLRRIIYPSASALVLQTNASSALLKSKFKVRVCTIPNPVEFLGKGQKETQISCSQASCNLVAMGRLVPQKGFDLLLNAFARISQHHPQWSLKIVGGGPLRADLENQSEILGIRDRVRFLGAVSDPFPIFHSADLFVLSSRFEGFPNALCEAMACGVPPVSFDCPWGPSEIIRDGVDGLLVPPEDVPALATALDRLMSDAQERGRLASRAPEIAMRFSRERILAMWDKLFEGLLPFDPVSR